MAFTAAIVGRDVWGSLAVTYGTFTNAGGGDTGGDINTGLHLCTALLLQSGGGSVIASAPVVNETLPVAGSAVTVVTTGNEDGTWIAFGDSHA